MNKLILEECVNWGSVGGRFRQEEGSLICELTTYDYTVTTSTFSFYLIKTVAGTMSVSSLLGTNYPSLSDPFFFLFRAV